MRDIIKIGSNEFNIELAITAEQQKTGLMYRDAVSPMAFVYPNKRINTFWMANVKKDLDILFCCANEVKSIQKGEAYNTMLLGGQIVSDLVIELPYGTAANLDIKIGDKIAYSLTTPSQIRLLSALTGFSF